VQAFTDAVIEVQIFKLTTAITSGSDRLAQASMLAVKTMAELAQVCRPPANPYAIALSLPHLRVLGLATQQLQGDLEKLRNLELNGLKDILSLGARIQFPDPNRINSARASQVIVNRTGATLHKIFRAYEEVTR